MFNAIFSIRSFIDLLTIIPGFFTFFFHFKNQAIAALAFLRSLRIFRVFEVIFDLSAFSWSIVKIEEQYDKLLELGEKKYNLKLEIYKIVSHLLCMIFISTNFLMTIQEVFEQSKNFFFTFDFFLFFL